MNYKSILQRIFPVLMSRQTVFSIKIKTSFSPFSMTLIVFRSGLPLEKPFRTKTYQNLCQDYGKIREFSLPFQRYSAVSIKLHFWNYTFSFISNIRLTKNKNTIIICNNIIKFIIRISFKIIVSIFNSVIKIFYFWCCTGGLILQSYFIFLSSDVVSIEFRIFCKESISFL